LLSVSHRVFSLRWSIPPWDEVQLSCPNHTPSRSFRLHFQATRLFDSVPAVSVHRLLVSPLMGHRNFTFSVLAFQPNSPSLPASLLGRVSNTTIPLCVPDEAAVTPPLLADGIYCLGFSLFTRRYLGNHCCFLFLHLLRCFNSVGNLT